MKIEKKQFDLKEFVESNIAFNDPVIQDYLLYLLIQGLKENVISSRFAYALDEFFARYFSELFASTETTLITNRKADVVIQDIDDFFSHIIEFKEERHQEFVKQAKRYFKRQNKTLLKEPEEASITDSRTPRDRTWEFITKSDSEGEGKSSKRQPCWEKVISDIETLSGLAKYYPNSKFYCGTILTSYHQASALKYPVKYMNYAKYESEDRRVTVFDTTDLDSECERNVKFIIESLVEMSKSQPYMLPLEIEQMSHVVIAKGVHRGVLVRGDMLFFEVKPI